MASPRTFKVASPHMKGADVAAFQREIVHEFSRMGISCPLKADGIYGVATRSFTASLCHSLGMVASDVMEHGVTPELRTRIRNRRLTEHEQERMGKRVDYRRRLRARYASLSGDGVAMPVARIIEDSWGYHGRAHDGIDVITAPDAPIHAMVKSKVIDVRGGPGDRRFPSLPWWGKSPSGDTRKGDGIIQLEVLENVGPFRKGQHIGYGHAEKSRVRKGQIVRAGQQIGHAGKAVAWHIHLMVNDGSTNKGIGNIDPRRHLDYVKENA